MEKLSRKTVNLYVTVIQIKRSQPRNWLAQKNLVDVGDFIARKLETWSDLTDDPWDVIGAARPLSYFEAAVEQDEVSLFWSSKSNSTKQG